MPPESPPSHRIPWPHQFASGKAVILVLLVALTSLAVGATTSPWLVPAYLLVMGWLLLARPADARKSTDRSEALQASVDVTAQSVEAAPVEVAVAPEPELEPEKPKKTRRRAKPKGKVEPPPTRTMATWVQVAPGKFIRVDVAVPDDCAEAGEPIADLVEARVPDQSDEPPALFEPEIPPPFEAPAVSVETGDVEPVEVGSPQLSDLEPSESPSLASEPVAAVAAAEPSNFNEETSTAVEPLAQGPGADTSIPEPDREVTTTASPVIVDEEPDDEETSDPPRVERLVVTCELPGIRENRAGRMRSIRIRKAARPEARRGNGRVGAMPRVVLHRA